MVHLKRVLKKKEMFTVPKIVGTISDRDMALITKEDISGADIIEVRVDWFKRIDPEYVEGILKDIKVFTNKPLLTTVRSFNEGGKKRIPDSERLNLYERLSRYSDYLDVEINSNICRDVAMISKRQKRVFIASYHNFDITPNDNFLRRLLKRGKGRGADIVKIVCNAKNYRDLLRLLLFTYENSKAGIITLSTGKYSRYSRLLSGFTGSLFTYGYVVRQYAPGQISVKELRHFFTSADR